MFLVLHACQPGKANLRCFVSEMSVRLAHARQVDAEGVEHVYLLLRPNGVQGHVLWQALPIIRQHERYRHGAGGGCGDLPGAPHAVADVAGAQHDEVARRNQNTLEEGVQFHEVVRVDEDVGLSVACQPELEVARPDPSPCFVVAKERAVVDGRPEVPEQRIEPRQGEGRERADDGSEHEAGEHGQQHHAQHQDLLHLHPWEDHWHQRDEH
mmetsp:Transcript_45268/g.145093  ORF Transcript_45268/g.145093 Transcript_45268/m.145093 type:complete len:211 (-) Transcript_45268:96-728(-)